MNYKDIYKLLYKEAGVAPDKPEGVGAFPMGGIKSMGGAPAMKPAQQQQQVQQPKQPQTVLGFATDAMNTVKGIFSQVMKTQAPQQAQAPTAKPSPLGQVNQIKPKQSVTPKPISTLV